MNALFADDDWFHHLTFAFSLCGMSLVWDHGCLESWLIFFICGAPGGIDYFWLGLVKEGKIKKIDEKRWNAKVRYFIVFSCCFAHQNHSVKMNTWVRGPGCLSTAVLLYANWAAGRVPHARKSSRRTCTSG